MALRVGLELRVDEEDSVHGISGQLDRFLGLHHLRHLPLVQTLEMHVGVPIGEEEHRLAQDAADLEAETVEIEERFHHPATTAMAIDEVVLEVGDAAAHQEEDIDPAVVVQIPENEVDPEISLWPPLVRGHDHGHRVKISSSCEYILTSHQIITTNPGYIVNDHRNNTIKVII